MWMKGGKGDKDLDNVQILCDSCHKVKHLRFTHLKIMMKFIIK